MQKFIDNWSASLLAPATASAVSLSVEPAKAALLTGLGSGNFYRLTLVEVDASGVEIDWDVVQVTDVAGGALTVIRADTARDWPAGTLIEARLTAAGMEELRDAAGGASVGSALPLSLGAAAPGTSPQASRQDHVHPAPSPGDIGAATSAQGAKADTAVQPAALTAALADKVDKVAGKGLSSNDYTTAEKNKLAGLESSHFKGLHGSLAALQAAHPSAVAGDYADVDAGAGVDVVRYLWDVSDSQWVAQAAAGGSMTAAQVKTAYESNPDTNAFSDAEQAKLAGIAAGATANADTDTLAEGATNKYFTEGRVRGTVLTGLSLLTGGVISAADSVLSSLGKLQKQISDAVTAIGGKQDTLVSGTNLKTVNGSSLLGAGDLSVLPQVVAYAGTSKTLALADINTVIDCTSSSAVTITIPPQSSVAWTPDAEIHVRMSGTGLVSITGGAGVTAPPMTLPVALSAQGAVVTLKRRSADVWAVVGGVAGSGDDLLSMFVNAEVAIAGVVTLTASAFGKMHVCSGTSADYTVTLPAVSGNAGKLIGFRMASGLTKLVTLDGNASELIDGAATRVMWANEVAVLLCNGTSWVKIAGKSVPMACEMYPTTAVSVGHEVNTKVPLESTAKDNSGSMADPVTNKRVNVKRPGIYRVQGVVYYQAGTQTMTVNHARIHVNGNLAPLGVNIANLDVATAKAYFNQHDVELTLALGDYIELYSYQASSPSASRDLYVNSTAFSYLAIVEKTTW